MLLERIILLIVITKYLLVASTLIIRGDWRKLTVGGGGRGRWDGRRMEYVCVCVCGRGEGEGERKQLKILC